MNYEVIATGSTGNAVLINDRILIDCGVAWKKLGPYAKKIKLVLLTHIHGDHFKPSTVRSIHRERPSVRFGCCMWMAKALMEAGVRAGSIDILSSDYYSEYDGIARVQPVNTLHNVYNCAYRLVIDGKRVFYATDCSTLGGISAKDYDLYMIEANHTRADIEARISEKRAAGAYAYEIEAMRNHLSREQAEEWLALNAGPNSKYVFLHQHKEDNA